MKVCWLVLAHANAPHFRELACTLLEAGDYVVAHVDRKSNSADFEFDGVSFVSDNVDVRWGGWSIVDATLRLMRLAADRYPDADYFWLISGDSFPVRSMRDIHRFLSARRGFDFINVLPMPDQRVEKPISRVSHYYIEHDPRRSRFKLFFRIQRKICVRPYRSRLQGLSLYCGSQWFTLSRSTFERLLALIPDYGAFTSLARTSWIPDEFYFHTILMSLAGLRIEPALFWADFRDASRPRPALVGEAQISFLESTGLSSASVYGHQEVLVARKFGIRGDLTGLVRERLWTLNS